MFIRVEEITIEKTRRSRHSIKKFIVCSCDVCATEFRKKYTRKILSDSKAKLTFCGRKCLNESRKAGGLLRAQTDSNRDSENWQNKMKMTLLQRYGVSNPGQMIDHTEKCAKTIKKNYGEEFTNALQLPYVREAMKESLARIEVIEKRKETNRRTWGHENVFGSSRLKERIKEILLKKYGVDHPSKMEGTKDKRFSTCENRHGYKCMFLKPEVKNKARQTFVRKYSHEYYWGSNSHKELCSSKNFLQKRHQTMKENGTYGKSRHEDAVYEFLLKHFPDIQRQVEVNGWSIDFYIPVIDVYLQLDGVYWHGLNRPREAIESSSSPRDKVILETMERDIRQNEWFKSNMMTLVRVTDVQDFEDILTKLS